MVVIRHTRVKTLVIALYTKNTSFQTCNRNAVFTHLELFHHKKNPTSLPLLTDPNMFLRCGRLATRPTVNAYDLQVLVELKVLLSAHNDNLALLVTVLGIAP